MEEKVPKHYLYIVVFLLLAVGAVLAWNYTAGKKGDPERVGGSPEEKSRELVERRRQIQALEKQVAELRKELDASSKRVADLQERLEDTRRALLSTEQKLSGALRQAQRPSVSAAPQPDKSLAATSPEPSPASGWRGPAERGAYEVIRNTSVFEEPSAASQKVSTIQKGTRVFVVGSVGDWLEVRSKYGKPPGFIRREDAMFIEKRD